MPYYYPLKTKMNKAERTQTTANLLTLRRQLDEDIPQKTATDTLLIATWNIRKFGNKRRWESLYYIAEIINRFDMIAIQEVTSDMKGLEKLMYLLGPTWDYIVTDATEGRSGGWERLAFVYDKCKIQFKKMAGEIVLPANKLIDEKLQFARTPYCVSFQAGWFKFLLTTVHIYYGSTTIADKKKREKEIDTLTSLLSKRANKEQVTYILLGDFNIPNTKDITMQALENHGFFVPTAIKDHPTDLGETKHYDQIAFNLQIEKEMLMFAEGEQRAGSFNFAKSIYRREDMDDYRKYFADKIEEKSEEEVVKYYMTHWRTYEMSDHLPLWAELKVDFSDRYLEMML